MVNVILKKPYAFLIKRFRLIHLILTIFIGYLLFSTFKLHGFFNRYVANVYSTLADAVPSNYITLFMFLIAIIIVIFSLAMYLLMKRKDKPRTIYIVISAFYVVLFGLFIYYFSVFKNIESVALSIKSAMLLRDLTLIFMLPQIGFFVLILVRALGFDIKKFNFSKDLKELDLSEEDSEEFEFIIGTDSYKYTRFLRRRLREFKYYILENKFMFTIFSGLVVLIIIIMVIMHFTVFNRTYGSNQRINANNLILQVNNSYLTNLDYNGNVISDGKYYLVANINFTNKSGASTVLDLTNYELITKSGKIYPTIAKNSYFIDLGAGYTKDKIENNASSNYIIVYELNESDLARSYTLRIVDSVEYKAGTINAKVKNVSLKPKTYDKLDISDTIKTGSTLKMYSSILNNSTLLVNSYNFMNKFTYKYEACIRNNCSYKTDIVSADATKGKALIVLSGNLSLDSNSMFVKNNKTKLTFFDAFVLLKYDGNYSKVKNLTPSSVLDEYILEVDSNASRASDVDLIITIRDKRYVIDLK